jgi:hypothetical protein
MLVALGLCEEEGIAALNEWCARQSRVVVFQPLDLDAAGGGMAMQVEIFAAAGNYYDHQALADAFPSFPWVYPDEAVFVAYPEDGPPLIVRGDGQQLIRPPIR